MAYNPNSPFNTGGTSADGTTGTNTPEAVQNRASQTPTPNAGNNPYAQILNYLPKRSYSTGDTMRVVYNYAPGSPEAAAAGPARSTTGHWTDSTGNIHANAYNQDPGNESNPTGTPSQSNPTNPSSPSSPQTPPSDFEGNSGTSWKNKPTGVGPVAPTPPPTYNTPDGLPIPAGAKDPGPQNPKPDPGAWDPSKIDWSHVYNGVRGFVNGSDGKTYYGAGYTAPTGTFTRNGVQFTYGEGDPTINARNSPAPTPTPPSPPTPQTGGWSPGNTPSTSSGGSTPPFQFKPQLQDGDGPMFNDAPPQQTGFTPQLGDNPNVPMFQSAPQPSTPQQWPTWGAPMGAPQLADNPATTGGGYRPNFNFPPSSYGPPPSSALSNDQSGIDAYLKLLMSSTQSGPSSAGQAGQSTALADIQRLIGSQGSPAPSSGQGTSLADIQRLIGSQGGQPQSYDQSGAINDLRAQFQQQPSQVQAPSSDMNSVMSQLRSQMQPQFAQEQNDLARTLAASAAQNGTINSGGYGESVGRAQSRLIADEGSRLTAYEQQALQSAQDRQMQASLANMSNATQRYGTNVGALTNLAGQDVQRHGIDVGAQTARYGADLGAGVNLAGQDVQRHGIDVGAQTAKYGTDMNAGVNLAGQDVQRHGIDVGAQTAKYGTDSNALVNLAGQNVQRHGIDVGAQTQRYGTDMGALTNLAGQDVQRHGIDVGGNNATLNSLVQKYGIDQNAQTTAAGQQLQKYGIDTSRMTAQQQMQTQKAISDFQGQIQAYGIKTNADLQRWLNDPNNSTLQKYGIDKNDLLERYKAKLGSDTSLQNAASGIQGALISASVGEAAANAQMLASQHNADLQFQLGQQQLNQHAIDSQNQFNLGNSNLAWQQYQYNHPSINTLFGLYSQYSPEQLAQLGLQNQFPNSRFQPNPYSYLFGAMYGGQP